MRKPFYKISIIGYYKLLRYYVIGILADIRLFIFKKWYKI
jgi:hypothetical protein